MRSLTSVHAVIASSLRNTLKTGDIEEADRFSGWQTDQTLGLEVVESPTNGFDGRSQIVGDVRARKQQLLRFRPAGITGQMLTNAKKKPCNTRDSALFSDCHNERQHLLEDLRVAT